ncbi:MAG TPA: hypothetical protein VEQ67_16455, partial [Mycobacterium sp.]|nr:hypothetical protein [Mycobacterium sp.]
MRTINQTLKTALLAGAALLSTMGVAHAQNTVNLTATRQTALMPDGTRVPMWGLVCGTGTAVTAGGTGTPAPTTTTAGAAAPTCTQTNGAAQALGTPASATSTTGSISTTWQPPLIRVPYTTSASTTGVVTSTTGLTITLTNNLPVRTSLVIVGQLPNGADVYGLGHPTREGDTGTGTTARPQHSTQTATTWTQVLTNQTPFTPPTQGPRARAFVQEAAAATATAAGTVTYTWSALAPGTYLIESSSYASIQGPMGLYGVLVVATAPTTTAAGTAYSSPCTTTTSAACVTTGVQYDADAVALLSEIDPQQNTSVDKIFPGGPNNIANANFASFSETANWTLACSTTGPAATANTCYPPAVDYTPMYYLVDGVAFDPANPSASQLNIGSST